eukprot:scaffold143894_cov27-Tisochrysis_lutea.AAC.2
MIVRMCVLSCLLSVVGGLSQVLFSIVSRRTLFPQRSPPLAPPPSLEYEDTESRPQALAHLARVPQARGRGEGRDGVQ